MWACADSLLDQVFNRHKRGERGAPRESRRRDSPPIVLMSIIFWPCQDGFAFVFGDYVPGPFRCHTSFRSAPLFSDRELVFTHRVLHALCRPA